MITHIIWDFNGTVLDDVRQAVAAVNDMLTARGLPTTDVSTYRDTLTMPLTEYYKTVGIFTNDIPTLSQEFYERCEQHPQLACIFDDVRLTVAAANELGIKNILMSSLHHDRLVSECARYGVDDMFDAILGLPDRGLGSKYDNAKSFFEKNNISADRTLFIGDLISDAQMAAKLGADCILIPNGHMSKKRCESCGAKVFSDVKEIIGYIKRA